MSAAPRLRQATVADAQPVAVVAAALKKPFLHLALLLALLIAGAYLPNVNGSYHFDDGHTISENPAMRNWSSVWEVWTDSRHESLLPANRSYRPLLFINYFLCWQIGGGETWPFHVAKMLMHLVFCLSVFVMWRRLFALSGWLPESMPRAWNADALAGYLAVMIAIHPASNECVNYITASSTLQCAMFYLLGFCAYLIGRERGTRGPMAWALVFYAASVLTKEEGITLPVVLLVYEWMRGSERQWRGLAPFFIALLALGFLQYKMLPESHAASRGGATPWAYFMTQWRAYLWYMKLWFWPVDLNADNVAFGFSRSFADIQVMQALVGNLLLIALVWINRRRAPALFFGVAWFYIAIAPASSIMPLAEPVNERRMFLSYAGFGGGILALMIPAMQNFARLNGRKLGAALALIIVALFAGAVRRSQVWVDDGRLWEDTLAKNPDSGRALNNLALFYMRTGKMEPALDLLSRCEVVWSSYAYCSINKAITLASLGRRPEAKTSFERAISLNVRLPDGHFYYANFLEKNGELAAAAREFLSTDEFAGGIHIEAKLGAVRTLLQTGNKQQAAAVLDGAKKAAPNEPRVQQLYDQLKAAP